jgi:hypothetical protein
MEPNNAYLYEIVVAGHFDSRRMRWFEPMQATALPDGNTRLFGVVADQAALYGLLSRMRDLGLTLVSVCRKDLGNSDQ